jgi:hypothetical protein
MDSVYARSARLAILTPAPFHVALDTREDPRLSEPAIVRLFHFQPVRPAFDAVLREAVLPELRSLPGVMRVWAGRQGPGELGARLIVSVWSSRAAMEAALGDDLGGARLHPEILDDTSDRHLDMLSLVVMEASPTPLVTGILRVTRGRLSDGDMTAYARLVVRDVTTRHDDGTGPGAVIVASDDGSEVVMVSTWPDWAAIESATGASVDEPLRVKRYRLSGFQVDHYELVDDHV